MQRLYYFAALAIFVAAAVLTVTAVSLPRWVSLDLTDVDRLSYGLTRKCSSLTQSCQPFPRVADCVGEEKTFCSLWRSTDYAMWVGMVLEAATVVGFILALAGGRARRESAWKVLSGLIVLTALVQMAAMIIVAALFEHDDRFSLGWELDVGWILTTVSWVVMLLAAASFVLLAKLLPPEEGYELIPDPRPYPPRVEHLRSGS